ARGLSRKLNVIEAIRRCNPLVAEDRALTIRRLQVDPVVRQRLCEARTIRPPGDRIHTASISAGLDAHSFFRKILQYDLNRLVGEIDQRLVVPADEIEPPLSLGGGTKSLGLRSPTIL